MIDRITRKFTDLPHWRYAAKNERWLLVLIVVLWPVFWVGIHVVDISVRVWAIRAQHHTSYRGIRGWYRSKKGLEL